MRRRGHSSTPAGGSRAWRATPGRRSLRPAWKRCARMLSTAHSLIAACRGADVILNALNPQYTEWAEKVMPMAENVIAAAQAVGATHMLPGNVYNFGYDIAVGTQGRRAASAVDREGRDPHRHGSAVPRARRAAWRADHRAQGRRFLRRHQAAKLARPDHPVEAAQEHLHVGRPGRHSARLRLSAGSRKGLRRAGREARRTRALSSASISRATR